MTNLLAILLLVLVSLAGYAYAIEDFSAEDINGYGTGQSWNVTKKNRNGFRVTAAGDFNGDGIEDMIMSGPDETVNGAWAAGAVYVKFGKFPLGTEVLASFFTGDVSDGVAIKGNLQAENLGLEARGVGDFNGDGIDDIACAAPRWHKADVNGGNPDYYENAFGAVYVIWGTTDFSGWTGATLSVADITADVGVTFYGAFHPDNFGFSVSGGGDFNGDGIADMVVGAMQAGASSNGAIYMLWGRSTGFDAEYNMATDLSGLGYRLDSITEWDYFGHRVLLKDDLNNDGLADVVASSWNAVGEVGAVWVIYGTTQPFFGEGDVVFNYEDGNKGVRIGGAPASYFGMEIETGDVNADGKTDLLVHAPLRGDNGVFSGTLFILFFSNNVPTEAIDSVEDYVTDASIGIWFFGEKNDYNFNFENWVLRDSNYLAVGDYNGDNIDDIALSAMYAKAGKGVVYTVYGRTRWSVQENLLDGLASDEGVMIVGTDEGDYFGHGIGAVGDFALNGMQTLGVGATKVDDDIGLTYTFNVPNVLRASADPVPQVLYDSKMFSKDLTGIAFGNNETDSDLGYRVGTAGDINGDSYNDVVLSAPGGNSDRGQIYVIFGSQLGFPGIFDLSDLAATGRGFEVHGSRTSERLSWSISSAGDFNGDGIDDMIIGSPRYSKSTVNGGVADSVLNSFGAAYIIYGNSGTWTDLDLEATPLDATTGIMIVGATAIDNFGASVCGGYDFNGDSITDVSVGAPAADGADLGAGAAYIIFGRAGAAASYDLSLPADLAALGYRFSGPSLNAWAGNDVTMIRDFDGDAMDDLLVGAYRNAGGQGAAYLLYGTSVAYTATDMPIADLTIDGTNGVQFKGPASSNFGMQVRACDFNGDGKRDFIFHGPKAELRSGATYVVYGDGKRYTTNSLDVNLIMIGDGTAGTYFIGDADDFQIPNSSDEDLLRDTEYLQCADYNDDGLDDIAIGAYRSLEGGGKVNVAFGSLATYEPGFYLAALDSFTGVTILGGELGVGFGIGTSTYYPAASSPQLLVGAWKEGNGKAYLVDVQAIQDNVEFAGVATLQVSDLDGGYGSVFNGTFESEFGSHVYAAGDFNGDGFEDWLIGARFATAAVRHDGEVYIVFGDGGRYPGRVSGSSLVVIRGMMEEGALGWTVAKAGDFNGDGVDDILLGESRNSNPDEVADWENNARGAAYVIWGSTDGFPAWADPNLLLLATDFNVNVGIQILGDLVEDHFGFSLDGGKDFNNDGMPDIVIGAEGHTDGGKAYVFWGKSATSDFKESYDLSVEADLNEIGFMFKSSRGFEKVGHAVRFIPDITGDGLPELVISAFKDYWGNALGAAYLIYGTTVPFSGTVIINGEGPNDSGDTNDYQTGVLGVQFYADTTTRFSEGLESTDFNGDGIYDLVFHSPYAVFEGSKSGSTYIVYGTGATFTGGPLLIADTAAVRIDGTESDFNASPEFILRESHYLGVGDFNGDSYGDVAISSWVAEDYLGYTHIVYGSPFPQQIYNLKELYPRDGVMIVHDEEAGRTGWSCQSVGDLDGDGADDLALGATHADLVYLIFLKDADIFIPVPQAPQPPADPYWFPLDQACVGRDCGQWNGGYGAYSMINFNDPSSGVFIDGDNAEVGIGGNVAAAGDINGDGFTDFVFTQQGASPYNARPNGGIVYVVYGSEERLPAQMSADEVDGLNGFVINGLEGYRIGSSLGGIGDFNGDSIDDLAIGAADAFYDGWGDADSSPNPGAVFVIFGRTDFGDVLDLKDDWANGTGVMFTAPSASAQLGANLIGVDMNMDGVSDLVVVAQYGSVGAEVVYFINGRSNGWPRHTYSLADFTNADLGVGLINNATTLLHGTTFGHALAKGDVNGDGSDDLIISSYDAGEDNKGAVWTIFAKTYWRTWENIGTFENGGRGFRLDGTIENMFLGVSVAAADVNGDGFADIAMFAPYAELNGEGSGSTYLYYGNSAAGRSTTNQLKDAVGARFDGPPGSYPDASKWTWIKSSRDLITLADLNNDNLADLTVGSPFYDYGKGHIHVIYGVEIDFMFPFYLNDADGVTGVRIDGFYPEGEPAMAIAMVGDMDGDGWPEFVYNGEGFNRVGRVYVIYGKALPESGGNTETWVDSPIYTIGDLDGVGAIFRGQGTDGDVNDNADTHYSELYWSGAHVGAWGAGRRVSPVGDINGDSYDDLAISAPHGSSGGFEDGGAVYVVYGGSTRFDGSTTLSTLDGINGFKINSIQEFANIGSAVAPAGDINGDGVGDFIVGAFSTWDPSVGEPQWRTNTLGEAWIFFGTTDGFPLWDNPSVWDPLNMPDGAGIHMKADTIPSWFGHAASGGHDINGDGYDDVVISAPDRVVRSHTEPTGSVYVILGRESFSKTEYDMGSDLTELGYRIDGDDPWEYFGHDVKVARDMNGDGYADIVVGTWNFDLGDRGSVYVFYGRPSFGSEPVINVETYVDGVFAVNLVGPPLCYVGMTVAVGDFNGDGLSDIATHGPGCDYNGQGSGSVYVALGVAGGFPVGAAGITYLDAYIDGETTGYRIDGNEGMYQTVPQMRLMQYMTMGDFNGDGFRDIVIGAPSYEPDVGPPGSAFIINGFAEVFDDGARRRKRSLDFPQLFSNLDGANGGRIDSTVIQGQFGYAVASLGDIDGDQNSDLLVGAPLQSGVGWSYLLYGIGLGYEPTEEIIIDSGVVGFQPEADDDWKDPCNSRTTLTVMTKDTSDESYWGARPNTERFLLEEAAEIFKRSETLNTYCTEIKFEAMPPSTIYDLVRQYGVKRVSVVLPDVIAVEPQHVSYFADQGVIYSLGSYFSQWSRETRIDQTANFVARVFYDYNYGGEWWASPIAIYTRFLVYRGDVFRDVLGHDNPPKDLDEMFEFARKINKTTDFWGLPLPTAPTGDTLTQGSSMNVFTPFVHAFGGKFYNNKEVCTLTRGKSWTKAVDYYTSYYKAGLSPLPDLNFEETKELFLNGQTNLGDIKDARATGYSAMTIDYWAAFFATQQDWAKGERDVVKITPLPTGPSGRFSFLSGEGLAISAYTDHRDAAWEWVRFMSDPSDEGFMKTHAARELRLPSRVEAMGVSTFSIDGDGDIDVNIVPMSANYLVPPYTLTPLIDAIKASNWGVPLQFPSAVSPVRALLEESDTMAKEIVKNNKGKTSPDDSAEAICDEFDDKVAIYRAPTPYDTDKTLQDEWMLPFLIVNSILLALTVIGAVATLLCRSFASIHFASWPFCVLMWIGCALALVTLYWWIIQPPRDWLCYCRIWFAPIVFTLVFGALSAKIARINILFNNKKMKVVVVTNVDLIKWLACAMIIPVVWAAVFSGVGSPEVDFIDVANETQTHFKQCSYDHFWIFMGIIYAYCGLILVANCYLAFRIRNVSYLFNESKEMIAAVYSVTILACVCLPLVHVFHDLPSAAFAITVCGAWAAIIIFLTALFALKFYPIIRGKGVHFANVNAMSTFQYTKDNTAGNTANTMMNATTTSTSTSGNTTTNSENI